MPQDSFPKLFSHILPKLWQGRPSANPERNDATLARVTDTDPVYRAIIDHAYGLLEARAMAAAQPLITSGPSREFLAGGVQALAEFIQQLEHTRLKAREAALAQQQRLAAQRR